MLTCYVASQLLDLVPFNSAIEDDYTGPCLEDSKVTLDFVKNLMDTFRDQKKLHRKFAYQVNV